MKIKTTKTERMFLMGIGVHYLFTKIMNCKIVPRRKVVKRLTDPFGDEI